MAYDLPLFAFLYTGSMNYYKVHHLTVASSLDLPELVSTEPQPAGVRITEGTVPCHLPGHNPTKNGQLYDGEILCEIQDDTILLLFKCIGRILIQGSNSMVVQRDPTTDATTMRTYILGTGLGFLLLKQGIFPFHGSTIITPYGAVMFVGLSGWGKSTTAAKFVKQGHTLLTDDVCVVRYLEGIPYAYPSSHRMKLWSDSIEVLGYDPVGFTDIMPGWEKKQVYLKHQLAVASHPLRAIYQLWPDDVDRVELLPLKGHEKLAALAENTFRVEGIKLLSLEKEQFEFCGAIARVVPIKRLSRPVASFDIDTLYSIVMEDLATLHQPQVYTK